jgi:uncharacterized membrane protein
VDDRDEAQMKTSGQRRSCAAAGVHTAAMSGPAVGLALSVFLACAVEAVEALTIVLAVGSTRSWRSALYGTGMAVLALGIVVAALGPAVSALPIGALRVAVGGLLLVFGLQWLRKAILRAAGLKSTHDELQTFTDESERARDAGPPRPAAIDGYAFAIAFKGVFLEGLEVVFIVLTFGANQHRLSVAVLAAAAAIVAVCAVGVAVRAPLARVPENAMKFAVGVMLCSFGTFWSVEGIGARWPGGEAALLGLIPGLALASLAIVAWLRRPEIVAEAV